MIMFIMTMMTMLIVMMMMTTQTSDKSLDKGGVVNESINIISDQHHKRQHAGQDEGCDWGEDLDVDEGTKLR